MRDDEIVVPIPGASVYTAEEAAALLKQAVAGKPPMKVTVLIDGQELARAVLPEIARLIRNNPGSMH